MITLFYSTTKQKMQLAFDMFDFDADGMIDRRDIHLLLSHVPLSTSQSNLGSFVSEDSDQIAREKIMPVPNRKDQTQTFSSLAQDMEPFNSEQT